MRAIEGKRGREASPLKSFAWAPFLSASTAVHNGPPPTPQQANTWRNGKRDPEEQADGLSKLEQKSKGSFKQVSKYGGIDVI